MYTTKIVVLDVETTGKDRARDQIVELCIQFGIASAGEAAAGRTWRIRPTVPIHPEATAVHGITAADLAECQTFDEVGLQIVEPLSAAEVIVGYNVAFDLDMVQAELERAKLPLLDLAAKQVVDVLRLWHHVEPRTLVAAHEKFLGFPMTNAHAAAADVGATGRVLLAMLEKFQLAERPWPEIAAIANPFSGREKWIGPSHHIQWDCGHPVIAFGKNAGVRLDRVDPGFLSWVVGKDFPAHVKEVCRAALTQRGEQFSAWIAQRFPRPAARATDESA